MSIIIILAVLILCHLLYITFAKSILSNSTDDLFPSSADEPLFNFAGDGWGNESYSSSNGSHVWFDQSQFVPSKCTQFLEDVNADELMWMDDNSASDDHMMDIINIPTPQFGGVHLSGVVEQNLWPNATIPTEIDEIERSPYLKLKLACAVKFIEIHSCIRFVRRQLRHKNYLSITMSDTGCYSEHLGMARQGRQIMNVDYSNTKCWAHGTIVHELMHVIGFYHEQSREDRDSFIEIHWGNIAEVDKKQYKKPSALGFVQQLIGEYDYASVMHYERLSRSPTHPAMSALYAPSNPYKQCSDGQQEISHQTGCDQNKSALWLQFNRPGIILSKILVIGGEDDEAASSMEFYHPLNAEPNRVVNVKMMEKRWGHTSALMPDGSVVILGGKHQLLHSSTCEKYHPPTAVTPCPSLDMGRTFLASSVLNSVLHVCGGMDWTNSCKTLISGIWQESVSMNSARSGLTMVTLDGYLYAIGGLDGQLNCLSSVERRNATDLHWTYVRSMNQGRKCHSAAVMLGQIFVCGGWGGNSGLSSCERYNPVDHQWADIARMHQGREYFALVSDGRHLFAMGGAYGSRQSVEIYNSINDTWSLMEKELIYKRLGHSAVFIP